MCQFKDSNLVKTIGDDNIDQNSAKDAIPHSPAGAASSLSDDLIFSRNRSYNSVNSPDGLTLSFLTCSYDLVMIPTRIVKPNKNTSTAIYTNY